MQNKGANDDKMTKKSSRHFSSGSSSAKYDIYEIILGFHAPTGHTLLNYVWYLRPFISHKVPYGYCVIYDAAVAGRAANHLAARVRVPSGLNIGMWERYATGHHEDQQVLVGVKYGFPLQYTGGPCYDSKGQGAPSSPTNNHASAVCYPAVVEHSPTRSWRRALYWGHSRNPPFTPWFHVSPLMLRPKTNSDERRIIADLSCPDGGINAHNLPTTRNALELVNLYGINNTYMSAIDISRVYRNFRTAPEDWPLLGIAYNGQYFVDLALPFGARMSSFYMQAAAHFIQKAAAGKGHKVVIYLDDILVVSGDEESARSAHVAVLQILTDLGLPVAEKKLVPPARKLVWSSIDIDLDENLISIPESKFEEIKTSW